MWETKKEPPPPNVHIESLETVNTILFGKGVFGKVLKDLRGRGGWLIPDFQAGPKSNKCPYQGKIEGGSRQTEEEQTQKEETEM